MLRKRICSIGKNYEKGVCNLFEVVSENQKLLAEQVSDQIIQLIIGQNLVSGQKLPNEFELASSLKVGRGTVREAVKLLISRNVLEIRRGKGTFVSRELGITEDPLGLAFFKDKYKLTLDLIEIRFMLEPQIAAAAAGKATKADIAEMKQLCIEIERLVNAGENYTHVDVELHTCIAQSTRNLVMPTLIPIIDNGIELFNIFPYHVERMKALQFHREIIDAIEAHDAVRASNAMIEHLSYNKRNLEGLKNAYEKE